MNCNIAHVGDDNSKISSVLHVNKLGNIQDRNLLRSGIQIFLILILVLYILLIIFLLLIIFRIFILFFWDVFLFRIDFRLRVFIGTRVDNFFFNILVVNVVLVFRFHLRVVSTRIFLLIFTACVFVSVRNNGIQIVTVPWIIRRNNVLIVRSTVAVRHTNRIRVFQHLHIVRNVRNHGRLITQFRVLKEKSHGRHKKRTY